MKALLGANFNAFVRRLEALVGSGAQIDFAGARLLRCDEGHWVLILAAGLKGSADRGPALGETVAGLLEEATLQGNSLFCRSGAYQVSESVELTGFEHLAASCFLTAPWKDEWCRDLVVRCLRRENYTEAVLMFLGRECRDLAAAFLPGEEYPYVLRVKEAPLYVSLHLHGSPGFQVSYRSASGMYLPWGKNFPLYESQSAVTPVVEEDVALIDERGAALKIPVADFSSLAAQMLPRPAGILVRAHQEAGRLSVPVEVKLRRCDPRQEQDLPRPELWLIPPAAIDRFTADLFCAESALEGLDACVIADGDAKISLALWTGGEKRKDVQGAFASLVNPAVRAYYRSPRNRLPLFLPAGQSLYPVLEESSLEACFHLERGCLTLVSQTPDATRLEVIPAAWFKPVRRAVVDYVTAAQRETVRTVLDNPLYDFGEPAVYGAAAAPEESGSPPSLREEAGPMSVTVAVGGDSAAVETAAADPGAHLDEELARLAAGEAATAEAIFPTRAPRTPAEVFGEQVDDLSRGYEQAALPQWRRYLAGAAAVADGRSDALTALGRILLLRPPEGVLEDTCRALGMEADWFWTKPPQRLFAATFELHDPLEPETTVLRLCASRDRLLAQRRVLGDNELRSRLALLRREIRETGQPALVWLLAAATAELSEDREALEEGRIFTQDLLVRGSAPSGLPLAVRRHQSRALMSGSDAPRREFMTAHGLSRLERAWFTLLTVLYVRFHPVLVPSRVDDELFETDMGEVMSGDLAEPLKEQISRVVLALSRLERINTRFPWRRPPMDQSESRSGGLAELLDILGPEAPSGIGAASRSEQRMQNQAAVVPAEAPLVDTARLAGLVRRFYQEEQYPGSRLAEVDAFDRRWLRETVAGDYAARTAGDAG